MAGNTVHERLFVMERRGEYKSSATDSVPGCYTGDKSSMILNPTGP